MSELVIIDYGSGNLHSATKAFERAAGETGKDIAIALSGDPDRVRSADRIVLPGVGAFADCLSGLRNQEGMIEALNEAVRQNARPFLGICVGMQLMADTGLEHGSTDGLGWIGGEVAAIAPNDPALKIPHMGWNTLTVHNPHPLLTGVKTGDQGLHAYFVHSYHFQVADIADKVAETDHGGAITAVVAKDNMVGTQFHPEKSQTLGLKVITNFIQWSP